MKGFIVVVLFIGIANADPFEHPRVLKRVAREAITGMGGVFLKATEQNIIYNCEANGLDSIGSTKLQQTYNDMIECMSKTRIFSVSKDKYIDKMVSCSTNAISETKSCLPDKQKYFPEFILDLAKSLVSFLYDDKSVISSPEVPRCLNNFVKSEVQRYYIDCMTNVAIQTHDSRDIPASKADFCGKFLPAGNCFPKTLLKYCDSNDKVQQFAGDYNKALEQPCETKEQ